MKIFEQVSIVNKFDSGICLSLYCSCILINILHEMKSAMFYDSFKFSDLISDIQFKITMYIDAF